MTSTVSSGDRERDLVLKWRRFAAELHVQWHGHLRSWRDHIAADGFEDEVRLIQPTVFPAFAAQFLGFEVGVNMSPELSGEEGQPDFTPADSVTHPFVFETKSTRRGIELADPANLDQVHRYLTDGRPRIRKVVLTNLVGLRVFELDDHGTLRGLYAVRLRDLLLLGEHQFAGTANAANFVRFVDEFSRRELTADEKIARIKEAHPWNPVFEVTSSGWVIRRLDRVVSELHGDVMARLGTLLDPAVVTDDERKAILDDLQLLGSRLADNLADQPLTSFLAAAEGSAGHVAVRQYAMHVAYYSATRLLLVRTWEDLGLLDPMLYDGGFRVQMARFDDAVSEVVDHSFRQARDRYRSLFQHSNHYSWYVPSEYVYVDVIYELAFTYLGRIDSDVLGEVYERLLARIDRKLLGQYFTPRDIIALIWDLIEIDRVAESVEQDDRTPRVLDIAAGSGGFLVEAVSRLRQRLLAQRHAGAAIDVQTWLNRIAESINGVEIQHFSRYLAELNLLVQLGQVVAADKHLRVAPIGVIAADTLALHEPGDQQQLEVIATDQPERARRIKSVRDSGFAFDIACGNPPYIGEKLAAPLLARTRQRYPYWEQFVGEHMDYLYWFLIVGVSKLAEGGRFGFITTEYWLRAAGARPLRRYIGEHAEVERILLFRKLRLFPDAPGQHSMIVIGSRRTSPFGPGARPTPRPPLVSVYTGDHLAAAHDRLALIASMRDGTTAARVRSFRSSLSPNTLRGESWADVVLTRAQLRQRAKLTQGSQLRVRVSKGVETTLNTLAARTADRLPIAVLNSLGWPERRPGIQLLTWEEVRDLGALSEDERRRLRPVVNTRDVFPYAVVLPVEPSYVLYLVKPDGLDDRTPLDQAIGSAFPPGLPRLEAHLERFRPVLEAATKSRKERRPWWTLHRPRFDVIGHGSGEDWEPYCLTTRWGGGNRLVVGLAPGGSCPASGLHILRPKEASASYLAALYNSSIYQAIVDTLPPGNVRADDLLRIGAPLFDDALEALSGLGLSLADLVRALVTEEAPRFPDLGDALRENLTLAELPDDSWTPLAGPTTAWGKLGGVIWIDAVEVVRGPGERVGEVRLSETLFGRLVEVMIQGSDSVGARVHLHPGGSSETAAALLALLRGVATGAARIREIHNVMVPISEADFVQAFATDRARLSDRVHRYRDLRRHVDAILDARLA